MAENKPKSMEGPPQGTFKTTGVLVDSPSGERTQHSGSLIDNTIMGGSLYVNLMVKDPYTGQAVRLDGIKVERTLGTIVSGIPEEGFFELTCPSYSKFKARDPEGMTALPKSKATVVQNTALPTPIKVKDSVDNFSSTSNSPVCKKFNENVNVAQRHLGLVHERDDLEIVQGPENGASPGMAINQRAGSVYLFGNDGKQNMNISPGGGVKMNAATVDSGSAQKELTTMNYGGMPQVENPMNNVVPQGTILMPQPRTVPNVLKILNMVATIVDMADLIKACSDAVKAVKTAQGAEEDQLLNDIYNDAAGYSSFEEQFMTEEEKEIANNPNMSPSEKESAMRRLKESRR